MEKWVCAKCGKKFDSDSALNQHDKIKHVSEVAGITFHAKTLFIYGIAAILAGVFVYFTFQSITSVKSPIPVSLTNDNPIVFDKPVHWHPNLKITIKGTPEVIPANVGIGLQYASNPLFESSMGMTGIHTHDSSGTLHWEIPRPPRESDLKIGNFFSVWKKTFDKDCIFGFCTGNQGAVKMFVNEKSNSDFENYLIKDRDIIEIRYE